jgi:PAS domain-containing protein
MPALWPPPALFDGTALAQAAESSGSRRIAVTPDGANAAKWFEVYSAPMAEDILFSAVDIDSTVHAETQLREFMQTLTKTFAHLKIGLAVFDRSRRLALFNPALTDLTTLPPDFLTSRPTLVGFLDRLRDLRMIPEPKDYKSWRRRLADFEAAASDGTYSETWSLPSGQTYRVSGRPHPGGAVAFLIENISAEVSLTRRFRSELEMGQAVVDSLDEAIAVFGQDGTLSMTNAAYESLWHSEAQGPLDRVSVVEATRLWMARCAPSPVWGEIRDFATQRADRSEWSTKVMTQDGASYSCRVVPLAGGLTLIGFTALRKPAELTFLNAKSA